MVVVLTLFVIGIYVNSTLFCLIRGRRYHVLLMAPCFISCGYHDVQFLLWLLLVDDDDDDDEATGQNYLTFFPFCNGGGEMPRLTILFERIGNFFCLYIL